MFYSKAWWMTSWAEEIKTTWKQQCQNFMQSIKTINNSNVLIVYLKHIANVELREFNVLLPQLCLDASALVKVWFHAMQFCWFLQSKQHLMFLNTSNWFLFQQSVVNFSSNGSLREKRDDIGEEGGRGEGVVQGYARGKFHPRPWVMTSRNIRHFLAWKIWSSIFLRVATIDLPSFASLLWPSLICKEHKIIMQGIKNCNGDQSIIGQAIQQ